MDVRLSSEQEALRDTVTQAVERLGPRTVLDLDDAERAARLDVALEQAGVRELRTADEDGAPLTSAVEPALVAEALARGLADAPFLGPTLATELRRLAGADSVGSAETVALTRDLGAPAVADGVVLPTRSVAFDAAGALASLVLVRDPAGYTLATAEVAAVRGNAAATSGIDLTRPTVRLEPAGLAPVEGAGVITEEQVTAWTAFGLALASAELVGIMDGAVMLARDYAIGRSQYGAPIGSYQAVQHLIADAYVLLEGSRSAALHAAWAVDAMPPAQALTAAAIAKAYAARAARQVVETCIQVHGGIGNTWECFVHVHLRRALFDSSLFGDEGEVLAEIATRHMGFDRGLR